MLATIEACERMAAEYVAQGHTPAARACMLRRAQLRDAQPSTAESDALAAALLEVCR